MTGPFRVLIVDDSPLFTELLGSVVGADHQLTVVGVATDGRQAVEMTARLRPHVITMDLQMPEMDGLEAIERIMASCPTPILVVTGDPRLDTGELHFEALRRGALDVLSKSEIFLGSEKKKLLEHLKLLAGIPVVRHVGGSRERIARAAAAALDDKQVADSVPERLVAIVASTGGPSALARLLEALPAGFPAGIMVVQHIGRGFTANLATWLNEVSLLSVSVAGSGDLIRPGKVKLAPEGHHMTVTRGGRIRLEASAPHGGHIPSGTLLLSSVAEAFGRHSIGLIMTGMGRDGVEGLRAIGAAGGVTLAQDEASSVVYGMPKVARETGAAQEALPLDRIPDQLCRLVGYRTRSRRR